MFSGYTLTNSKISTIDLRASQMVKNLPACIAGDLGSIPGQEDPLEKEMATHFSILTWKIPWTEEPAGLQSMAVAKSRT